MGLRTSLDEGAGDVGEAAGEDLPSTPVEVRERVPESADVLVDANGAHTGDDADLSIESVVSETPLERFL